MSSPFSDFANATLIFAVATGTTAIDPATGNRSPVMAAIRMSAMLKQGDLKGDSEFEQLGGADRASLFLSGRAIKPLQMPNVILPYSKAAATFQGQNGEFTLHSVRRSPYRGDEFLGDRIKGWFQVKSFATGEEYSVADEAIALLLGGLIVSE